MASESGRGWILLHRRITEHSLWPSGRKFTKLEAWLDMLLMANFKDSKVIAGGRFIQVRRGQVFTSQVALAERWRWNRKSVIAFLKLLKTDTQVDIETGTGRDSGFTLITICNYGKYQTPEEPLLDNNPDNYPDSETDNKGAVKGQLRGTSEESKEGKEDIPPAARAIIGRLNAVTGVSYPCSKASTRYLCARLRSGASEADCIDVLEHRWQLWGNDPEMKLNVNPKTLFRPENFERYLAEARANGKPATTEKQYDFENEL